jgi:hypothetical protein
VKLGSVTLREEHRSTPWQWSIKTKQTAALVRKLNFILVYRIRIPAGLPHILTEDVVFSVVVV